MKKFILLILVLFCTFLCANAQSDTSWSYKSVCYGNSTIWTIPFASNFDICVCSHNGVYDTITGNVFTLFPDSTTTYVLVSINGNQPDPLQVYARKVTVNIPPTFTVDSIHSPTCPYPYLGPGSHDSPDSGPWADGGFSVILDDSVQNYESIKVRSDSSFFFVHSYHDDFTINGLRGGTYNIVARGTNGCEVTQHVTIIQPDEWYYVYEEPTPATCSSLGSISVDSLRGGTQPFHYHWTYFLDTNLVFPDTSVIFGDTGIYNVDIIDANGCVYRNNDFMWRAIDRIDTDRVYLTYYETVPIGDTVELINAPDSIDFCRTNSYFFNAMSLGHGCEDCDTIYSWSDNFYGREEAQNHDPVSVSGWLTVHFTDQNGCPSADSIYIDIYIPEFNILGISDSMFNDSTYTIIVSPAGGNLIFNGVEILLDSNGNGLIDLNGLNPGTYQIDYSGEFGPLSCFDEHSWTFEVQQKVGIDEYSNKFSIYPNPASNTLNIEFSGEFSGDILLFDMTGRLLKTTEKESEITSIDVSDLTSGVYFIRFVSQNGTFTKKFVKK